MTIYFNYQIASAREIGKDIGDCGGDNERERGVKRGAIGHLMAELSFALAASVFLGLGTFFAILQFGLFV